MYSALYLYTWYMYTCMYRYMHSCAHKDQRMSGVPLYDSPPYSLEAGSFAEPGSRLIVPSHSTR